MVTKAELEAELAQLRKELSARQAAPAGAEQPSGRQGPDAGGASGGVSGSEALEKALSSLGLDVTDIDLDGLWKKLSDEVGDVAAKRPALTAIAVFALGFVLGRMSK